MNRERPETTAVDLSAPRTVERAEEVDLWWGSCSAWALTPSFLVCLSLTIPTVWVVWYNLPRGWAQPAALGAGGLLWSVQFFRWSRRFFGFTYRLTTRRLIVLRGLLHTELTFVELSDIGKVMIASTAWERRLGIGRMRVWREGQPAFVLELEGVANPHHLADLIRELAKQSRQHPPS